MEQQQECSICLEPTNSPFLKLPCKHNDFCADCIFNHAEAALARGQVPACCPATICEAFLTLEVVNAAALQTTRPEAAVTLAKYTRLHKLRTDPSATTCPKY